MMSQEPEKKKVLTMNEIRDEHKASWDMLFTYMNQKRWDHAKEMCKLLKKSIHVIEEYVSVRKSPEKKLITLK